MVTIREAEPADADGVGDVLEELRAAGKRTAPADADFALSQYIRGPGRIRCSLAIGDGGRILGLQSLKLAGPGNPYGTPVGQGIIGTHIRPSAARQGVGRALFDATLAAVRAAGLTRIEALIGADNAEGRAYYAAMGFETLQLDASHDRKCLSLG